MMSILTLLAILAFGFAVGYTVAYSRYRVSGDSVVSVNKDAIDRKDRNIRKE